MKKNDFFFIYLFFIQIYLSCDDRRVLCYFHGLCPISKKVYEHYSYQRAPRKIYWSHSYQLTEWWRRSRPIIFPSYTHPVLLLSSISIYCDLSPSYMGTLCFSPFIHQSPFFFLAKILPICHIRTSCLVLFSFLSVCVSVCSSLSRRRRKFLSETFFEVVHNKIARQFQVLIDDQGNLLWSSRCKNLDLVPQNYG